MGTKASKNLDLKEVIAKAGALDLKKLIPKRGAKGQLETEGVENSGEVSALTNSDHPQQRLTKKIKNSSVGETLKASQREAKELKARLAESKQRMQVEKKATVDAKSRADRAESVLAELRKELKVGRDAKVESLPSRLKERLEQADEERQKTQQAFSEAILKVSSLEQSLAEKVAELDRILHEEEPIVINPQPAANTALHIPTETGEGSISIEEEIAPSLFNAVDSDIPIETLITRYAQWVLGKGEFDHSRKGRMEAGLLPTWEVKTLADGIVSLHGDHGLRIDVRGSGDHWRLKFQHRDFRTEGTTWINLVRLARRPLGGTKVEHAVIRNTGAGSQRPAPGGLPRILRDLLRGDSNPAPWAEFRAEVKEINEQNVAAFVNQILMNRDRDMPVVYVTRAARAGGAFSLNDRDLVKALDGLAVVYIQSFRDQRLFTETLIESGMMPDAAKLLSCFDGGVRLYRTGLSLDSDAHSHPLWTRARLEARTEPARVRMISASVVAQTVPQRFPRGFSRLIEDYDLDQSRLLDQRMAAEGDLSRQVAAKNAHINALEEALEQSRIEVTVIPMLKQKVQALDAQYLEALHENERLERESDDRRQEIGRLKVRLESIPEFLPEVTEVNHKELLLGLLDEGGISIGAHLRILQALYPDRVEVLSNGLKTADNCQFMYPKKARELLFKLVTSYYEKLLMSGDTQAARIFGDDYSPFESTNLSKEGERARTFLRSNNTEFLMTAHLKQTHGRSRSSTNVLRIHFYWLAEEKKILIGHVGAHLPL